MSIDWREHYELDHEECAYRCRYYIHRNYPDMAALLARELAHLVHMAGLV